MHERRSTRTNKTVSRLVALLCAIGVLGAVFFVSHPAQARPLDFGMEYAQNIGLAGTDIRVIAARIIQIALGMVGLTFVVLILYGGYQYMTAAGNAEQVDRAKKTMRNATIGVIIMLSSYAIASFIIGTLIRATTGGAGGGGGSQYGAGGGALGNGIIESHYPPRNGTDIPRNTSIVVTFKQAMNPATLVTADGLVNAANVRIHKTADATGPYLDQVRVSKTDDNKTFVFKPQQLLGSPVENTLYTIDLTRDIQKENGEGAFGSLGSYAWSFEVSTVVDVTPPQVSSVIPFPTNTAADAVARNAVVQINFNEPVNPLTIRGIAETDGGTIGALAPNAFKLLTASVGPGQFVAGEFFYSNGYQTVEFITNDPCGINSCGEQIFCLPGDKNIAVDIRAATPDSAETPARSFPYDGVVDMADNALDGNKDGSAAGPVSAYNLNAPGTAQGDSVRWSFFTNDRIDLVPPEAKRIYPGPGAGNIDPAATFESQFTKLMMSSTLKAGTGYGDGACGCSTSADCGGGRSCIGGYCYGTTDQKRISCTANEQCGSTGSTCKQKEYVTLVMPSAQQLAATNNPPDGWGYWITSASSAEEKNTTAFINHETLGGSLGFTAHLGSGVKDLYQNCFQPCSGIACKRQETAVKGQYTMVPGSWLPADQSFPTCDLSVSGAVPTGNFSATYTGAGGGVQTQRISAFSMDQTASDFYAQGWSGAQSTGIQRWGFPFSGIPAARRSSLLLFYSTVDAKYYLTVINGAEGGPNGSITYDIANIGALDPDLAAGSVTNQIVVRDDSADSYSVLPDGQGIAAQWSWGAQTDGLMLSLGTGNAPYSFTVTARGSSGIDEWILYYPGGEIPLSTAAPVSITFTPAATR